MISKEIGRILIDILAEEKFLNIHLENPELKENKIRLDVMGYKEMQIVTTQGKFNVRSRKCSIILNGYKTIFTGEEVKIYLN